MWWKHQTGHNNRLDGSKCISSMFKAIGYDGGHIFGHFLLQSSVINRLTCGVSSFQIHSACLHCCLRVQVRSLNEGTGFYLLFFVEEEQQSPGSDSKESWRQKAAVLHRGRRRVHCQHLAEGPCSLQQAIQELKLRHLPAGEEHNPKQKVDAHKFPETAREKLWESVSQLKCWLINWSRNLGDS